jgi:release factor glutamine methyltransferase
LNEFVEIASALRAAVQRMESGSECPRLDAELLLARALDVPRSYLIAHPEDTLDPAAGERFFTLVERRAAGEPMAYITGEKEFWSMNLMVSPDTLVPRPETELLVERALMLVGRRAPMRVVDLGTGSGAIALALARERPLCEVVATDLSEAALAIAQQNARQLELGNITFEHGNWIKPVAGRQFDLVVSNPPYVRADDPALRALRHEPVSALASGADGLDDLREIAKSAGAILVEGGHLLLEHGSDQQDEVARLLEKHGWTDIECLHDLGGRPRVTIARKRGQSPIPENRDSHRFLASKY